MFGSLWNVVVAREHRRQDGSRRPGTTAKCQTATGVRASQRNLEIDALGVPVASVGLADGTPALTVINESLTLVYSCAFSAFFFLCYHVFGE